MNNDSLIFYRCQTFLTKTPDHSVDVRLTKPEHIGYQLLRQRQCVGKMIAGADSAKSYQQFEEQMGEPLEKAYGTASAAMACNMGYKGALEGIDAFLSKRAWR